MPQPLAPLAAPLPGAPAPAPLANFAGMQVGTGGVPASAPSDSNGAVGPNHYVQMVNVNIAVYSKAGTLATGFPKLNNAIWSAWAGMPGGQGTCASQNQGDPIVLYDRMADRWLLSQLAFQVSGGNPVAPFYQCVAVSQTADPTGAYNLYVFGPYDVGGTAALNDYPKIGVWPDGYYATYNMFTTAAGGAFAGAKVCVWDRAKMLAGLASLEQCFQLGTAYGGLLPSDLDGRRAPPAGSPNIATAFSTTPDVLQVWKFHVDWTTPANSTLTGPATIPVNAITLLCPLTQQCIPQFNTTNKLDALGDRLMFRAAYRNLGGQESLVLNHTVDPGAGKAGVRWYELRNATGQTMGSATPVLRQQGTFAPDAFYRWMGSVAQDQVGDMAAGYSHSDPTAITGTYPSIRYAARSWSAAAGTLDFSETILQEGLGAQTGTLARWGDYTALAVDPTDDCTFWYTNQYLPASGTFNWATRIGSFKLPTCPAKLVLTSLPTCATAGIATSFTVAAQDNLGAALTWFAGTANLSTSDAAATLPATAALSGGQASVPVTFATPGTRTVTATDGVDPSLTATGSVPVVSNAAAASYGLSLVPAAATAGTPFTFTITARDGCGNVAAGYTGPATVTSTDPQAVLPASVTFTAGVATGVQVTLKTSGARTVSVTDNANAAVAATAAVTVSPAAAASYTLAGLPVATIAGTALAATVTAKDAYGNVATGYTGPATATSTDPQAVLPASVPFTAGVASSVPVVLKTSGPRAVTVTDNTSAAITATGSVTVGPAAAASYTLAGLPATAGAGTALSATVTAKDPYGNVATGYGGPANVTSDDPQAVLPAPVAFAAGVASVPVTLKTLGAHTVTATDAANAALTATGSVQVGSGPAASYVVTGPPPPVKAGTAASFTVAAKDAFGNAAIDYAGTAAVTSSDGKAVLPGNLAFSAGSATGGITFKTRGSQTVTVTDTSNASVTGSATVSVEAGASSGCGCGSAPGGELAGLLLLAGLAGRRRAPGAGGPRPGRGGGP